MRSFNSIQFISLVLIFLMISSCDETPSTSTSRVIESRIGERRAQGERSDTRRRIENGEVLSSNNINSAISGSLSSPIPECHECGQEEDNIYETGSFKERFEATKNVSKYIMNQNQVSEMDQLNFSDKADFCPKYDSLNKENRKDFWSTLLASMAIYESGIKPGVSYDEGQTSDALNGVTSRGLVQMSFDSARQSRYVRNGCVLDKPRELHIPHVNLRCALAAMKTLVKADGCIACGKKKGAAKYWSTLRNPYRVFNKRTGKWMKVGKKPEVIKAMKMYKPECF